MEHVARPVGVHRIDGEGGVGAHIRAVIVHAAGLSLRHDDGAGTVARMKGAGRGRGVALPGHAEGKFFARDEVVAQGKQALHARIAPARVIDHGRAALPCNGRGGDGRVQLVAVHE